MENRTYIYIYTFLYYLGYIFLKNSSELCIPRMIHPNFRIMVSSQGEGNNMIGKDKGISTSS